MAYEPKELPVTRVAPSPTGDPHVGTAYAALFSYALAKRHGGRFILRIEDTDQTRSTKASEVAILDSLRWLGLQWDEGPDIGGPQAPYYQSERTDIYRAHCNQLIGSGGAYRCFCTTERLAELRTQQRLAKKDFGYDGLCRDLSPQESADRADAGEPHVVRLRMPREGHTVVNDLVRGEVVIDNAQVDDQVLLKSDGFPTYHLANVVDDHLMGVNHVLRGEEWLNSAPKHLVMYDQFGWEPPVLCHLPLLRNPDRSKLSKRKNPTSIKFYRRLGILPSALLNYLAMMGWTMPDGREFFSLEDMVKNFDPTRIALGGPVFDTAKLTWLNGKVIRENMTPEELQATLKEWLINDEFLGRLMPLVQPRLETLSDFIPLSDYMLSGQIETSAEVLVPKKKDEAETLQALIVASTILEEQQNWTADELDPVLRRAAQAFDWELRDFLAPIFGAISGRKVSLPLFDALELLGKDLAVVRLRDARNTLGSLGRKKQDKLLKRFRKAYASLDA